MSLNGLVLNLDKINIIKFIMNNSPHCTLRNCCKEEYVEETGNRNFLICKCITTSNGRIISIKRFLNYVQHFMQIGGCSISATLTLSDQFLHIFHCIIKCAIIFGGILSNSGKIFT